MPTKRNSWRVSGKLCGLCIVLVLPGLAGPAPAKPVLTILPPGTLADAINDSGAVAGEENGLGFLRMPDGSITTFKAADDAVLTGPERINNAGVMTGFYTDAIGALHGFVRDAAGAITTFDAPGASETPNDGTSPVGINANGIVTGTYYDKFGNAHGFVRAMDGTITSFDVRTAYQTLVTGINDAGEIVGYWDDTSFNAHGFVRSAGGRIKSFEVPGSLGARTSAINGNGDVTGFYWDQMSVTHGYIRRHNGQFTTFDTAQDFVIEPEAINAGGTVAGFSGARVTGPFQGFVRTRNGKVKTLSRPRASVFVADINTSGVVAGSFVTPKQVDYGFIWTP